MSSMVIAGYPGGPGEMRGITEPMLIVFGGYDGNGQRYLGDLWKLSLAGLVAEQGELKPLSLVLLLFRQYHCLFCNCSSTVR